MKFEPDHALSLLLYNKKNPNSYGPLCLLSPLFPSLVATPYLSYMTPYLVSCMVLSF